MFASLNCLTMRGQHKTGNNYIYLFLPLATVFYYIILLVNEHKQVQRAQCLNLCFNLRACLLSNIADENSSIQTTR
jgi:hypothetical protein